MRLDNDENHIVHGMLYSVSTKSSESRRHIVVFILCVSLFGVGLEVFRVV